MRFSQRTRRLTIFTILVTIFIAVPIVILDLSAKAAHFMTTNPISERMPPQRTPVDFGINYETVELMTEDGLKLAGWYIPSQNSAAVILAHGYKGDRSSMLDMADLFARHGFGVLLFDNRAHGESEGERITFGIEEMEDFEAAFQYLLTREDVDPDRIGLLGISNGGAMVVLYAAQNSAIRAVVADSAYATLKDEVAVGLPIYSNLPAFPFAPFVEYFAERELGLKVEDVSPLAVIGDISPGAVLIIQGGLDKTIPADSGKRLYEAAGMPKDFWYIEGAGHTSALHLFPEDYEARIIAFFDRYLAPR